MPLVPIPWPINYNHTSRCKKFSTHSWPIWFWLKIFSFPSIHGVMYDHILRVSSRASEWKIALGVIPRFDIDATSLWWKFRTTRGAPSSWNWTPQAWYYRISSNFSTLVILLQVDLASNDELEIVYEGFYKIENTSIFAWSWILGVGHYCWLRGLIHRLPLSSKVDYLVRIIWCIINFLQLWIITVA